MNQARRTLDSETDEERRFEDPLQRVLAGRGSGQPCAHCHELISAAEVEYEIVESADAADSLAQQPTPRLHLRCFEAWRAIYGR
jgi:hypothetical protein